MISAFAWAYRHALVWGEIKCEVADITENNLRKFVLLFLWHLASLWSPFQFVERFSCRPLMELK